MRGPTKRTANNKECLNEGPLQKEGQFESRKAFNESHPCGLNEGPLQKEGQSRAASRAAFRAAPPQ